MKCTTALVLAVCLSLPLWAQDQQVNHPSGFQTRLPASFKVSQDASGLLAVAPDQSYMVILKSHTYPNFDSFARQANLEKDGFSLVGEVRSLNATDRSFRAAKQTATGYLVADTFVSFSPYGGGSLIVALSNEKNSEAAYQEAYQMAHNLQFSQPKPDQLWSSALAGKHLVYLYNGNGYSERKDLYLAGNGQFAQRNDASSASINGSGWLAGGGDGRWQVLSGGLLVLQFNNGQTGSYSLSPGDAGNEVLLNGKRYFVMRTQE
ncbi:MAG: hypothetical protein U0931_11440 [Vulcanimicrobiota bacterium]